MSTCCSTARCNEEQDMIVGTSTSGSASCGHAHGRAHRDVLKQDLGHFDNLIGNQVRS